jgi:hypothetical protein
MSRFSKKNVLLFKKNSKFFGFFSSLNQQEAFCAPRCAKKGKKPKMFGHLAHQFSKSAGGFSAVLKSTFFCPF